eukprot:5282148-Pleurochrysis_carterae.AAC.3
MLEVAGELIHACVGPRGSRLDGCDHDRGGTVLSQEQPCQDLVGERGEKGESSAAGNRYPVVVQLGGARKQRGQDSLESNVTACENELCHRTARRVLEKFGPFLGKGCSWNGLLLRYAPDFRAKFSINLPRALPCFNMASRTSVGLHVCMRKRAA